MSITVHEFDGITRQFRVKPDEMPRMSTETMTPNYLSIRKFELALRENALAISSYQTHLGHLALVVSPEEYNEVSNNIPFVTPVNPGLRATRAVTAKDQIDSSRQFTFQQNEFMKYQATVTALRNLIINSIDDKYIRTLRHDISCYANVQPYDLLQHIWKTYGKIDDADHTANEQRMKAPWSPPTPIEALFDQLDDGQLFASKGNEVIDDSQLMRWAYDNIKATGLFEKDCDKWRKRPPMLKNWSTFKTFFITAEDDRKKNKVTANDATYTANQVQQIINDEINAFLADPSVTDVSDPYSATPPPPPLQPSASANAAVTAAEVRTIIQEALRSNSICPPATNSSNSSNTRNTTRSSRSSTSDRSPSIQIAQAYVEGTPVSYCWSHGITRNLQHSSQSCSRPKEGHQRDATYHDRKGGSDFTMSSRRS